MRLEDYGLYLKIYDDRSSLQGTYSFKYKIPILENSTHGHVFFGKTLFFAFPIYAKTKTLKKSEHPENLSLIEDVDDIRNEILYLMEDDSYFKKIPPSFINTRRKISKV